MKKSCCLGVALTVDMLSMNISAARSAARVSINSVLTPFVLIISVCLSATAAHGAVIGRINLDGSGLEVVVGGLAFPGLIAVDVIGRKTYWTEEATIFGTPPVTLRQANLDGTDVTYVATIYNTVTSIAVDGSAGQVYWNEWEGYGNGEASIQRVNIDGSGMTNVVAGLTEPQGLALDLSSMQIYWGEAPFGNGSIRRANLDGTNVTDIIVGLEDPTEIALDDTGDQIYWTEADAGMYGKIFRANFDGSGLSELVTGGGPVSIALDVDASKMYWTGDGGILRANLDGTSAEIFAPGAVIDPSEIALDTVEGKLYFIADAIVPIPPALYLFGSGLLGLVGLARRKRPNIRKC